MGFNINYTCIISTNFPFIIQIKEIKRYLHIMYTIYLYYKGIS